MIRRIDIKISVLAIVNTYISIAAYFTLKLLMRARLGNKVSYM